MTFTVNGKLNLLLIKMTIPNVEVKYTQLNFNF